MNSFQLVSIVFNSTDENKERNHGYEMSRNITAYLFLVKQFMLLNYFDVLTENDHRRGVRTERAKTDHLFAFLARF